MRRLLLIMLGFGILLFFSCINESIKIKQNSQVKNVVPAKVNDKFYSIPISDIRLRGEIGRRIDNTIVNNVKMLDLNRDFTKHFQEKLGTKVAGSFIGMGMLIDACVKFAAYSKDQEMISIKNEIVGKIIDSQLESGYSGFYDPEKRLWDGWDIHEMAFIIDGLISDYQLFDHKKSLDAAIKTADYILSHWAEMPDDYGKMVDVHVLDTGIDGAILRLFKITGESRFLNFSQNMKPLADWDTEIVIGRRIGVSGHMFAYLAMCQAQLELYRLFPDKKLLIQTQKAMNFLLDNDGLTITGCSGIREIWTNDQDGDGELGESCATAYQIRVYENLLRLFGDSRYGDLIERTVFNGLFAAQSPDGRKIRYYTPFEGERIYYPHDYMCCPGNFRRIISELPAMVYYNLPANGVAINLYTASSVFIELADGSKVNLQQETDYPNSGRIKIAVMPENPRSFTLLLRIPAWAKSANVTVNGKEWNQKPESGTFFPINRKWYKGDTITLNLPMDFRFVKGRERQAGRVAIMRGPVIYCFNPSLNPAATKNGERTFDDLRRLQLDPGTLTGPILSDTIRPDGMVAFINGWRENNSGLADTNYTKYEFKLLLTEFIDPDGKLIYFKLPDLRIGVNDELIK